MIPSENGHLFEIVVSQHNLNILKQIQAEEIKKGKGKQFLDALRALNDRLRNDPKGFGEALYRLPALNQVVYVAVVTPLIVHYGIHEEKPLVFIRWFQATSD